MQTTLLGLAIAFIIALIAALVGPYYIDWNQFRPQFEAEATRIVGAPVRVAGKLDARLLPAPSLQLRSVTVGGANDLGKVRADKLDVEFSLGSLMRGKWRATELTINGMALDLGLDARGRIDWPASTGTFNFGQLAIDRLNLTGRVALEDIEDLGGKRIPKGDTVLCLLGSANHDPAVYPDHPERLDITRPNVKPLSFGGGIHFCLGAQLARIEAEIAISTLLRRIPNLRLDDAENPEWRPTFVLRGLKRLPASW